MISEPDSKKLVNNSPNIIINLAVYSIVHALVDWACAILVFGGIIQKDISLDNVAFFIVLYNILAFGLQPVIGHAVDYFGGFKWTSALGCIFVAGGVIAFKNPIAAVILAGVGNALFHVGGGVLSLGLKAGSAGFPGIYVAPGAMGLVIGTLMGKSDMFYSWSIVSIMLTSAAIIAFIKSPSVKNIENARTENGGILIAVLLILLSIVFRALIGFMLNYQWKSDNTLLIVFTFAVVLGKAFGGFLADRYGWKRVAVSGLVFSALLLSTGSNYPAMAITGVFLFNLTMPVTLAAISNMLPGRSGFAFGLTTLALIIGSIPSFTKLKTYLSIDRPVLVIMLVLLMASILYLGISLYERKIKNVSNTRDGLSL